ncbi:Cna B-type domain-containing protein [Senegalia sp. (in: firmicutes)]|uniref:Cna B-type domain-containing protein n=1 Tax=Senegalia sp. (in: firmicutes) TaxID=1924098 RepID=UPI003F9C3EAB
MKNFYKRQSKIIFMVVIALILQMVAPVIGFYSFAEEPEKTEELKEVNQVKETKDQVKEQEEQKEVEGSKEVEKAKETEDQKQVEEKTESEEKKELEIPKESEQQEELKELEKKEEKKKKEDKKEVDKVDEPRQIKKSKADEEKQGFILEVGSVTDLDNKPFDNENLLKPKDEFKLNLDWNLKNGHNYKDGDKVVFDLPKGIKIEENIDIELKDGNLTVAKATIKSDNKVEITFTDFVETHSNVLGYINIISQIDEENSDIDDGDVILQPIGDEGIIKIPVDLGDREKTIEKKGSPNKGYNADEINWSVTINKFKNNLKNAKVADLLPQGTEYKEGSLKVTKLKVDLKGNILGDLEEIDITNEGVENGKLNIPLGNIKDAYRIEYVTKVTNDHQKTFKNKATLSDDDLEDVSSNATVTINRGDPIKKSVADAYNPKTRIIKWKIEFNFNQKDLNSITLKDSWQPEGKMSLVADSLEFQEVTIDENGKSKNIGKPIDLPEGSSLINSNDKFEVKNISTDKAYVVTYQTKVDDRVLERFKIKNSAKFGNDYDESGTNVGTYYGLKSAGNIDYKNKTIDWKIEINHDEYPMEKISIKDTLGAGLKLDKSTIEIKVDGKKYEGDYTVSDNNPFTLKFPDGFTTDKKIVIDYKTKFVADEIINNNATNKADISWTPEGKSGSITKEVKANKDLNTKTKDNSWKKGSYNPHTKEITWTIYTNYRENQINDLIIKDMPKGNQKIVENSAVVTELEILSDGKIKEVKTLDQSVSAIDTEKNSLKVNIGKTNKAYKIEYKTSIADLSDIQKEYVNKAKIYDDPNLISEIDAKVGIAKAHTYGAKSGYQEGKQVHWAVTVNPGQQKVKNLKLEDTVSSNQDILKDTFKVYEATVDKNGVATKTNELDTNKYKLTHTNDEPRFTVEWLETVERAFVVEYSTLFFEKHNGEVTNSYEVTGDNIVKDGTINGSGKVKIKQLASGGGSGEAGYLVIDKVDTSYGQDETKLAGAEFDLIDPDTKKVLKTGKTDENGKIDFGRLLFGDYKLKERVVPDGYVSKNEEQTITIDKTYDLQKDKVEYTNKIENYKPVFAIELIKKDENKKLLAGAEFTLYDSKDKELVKSTTDSSGKILFENLKEAGNYYIKETKAPSGYVLDTKKYQVTVGEKEEKPIKLELANKARGAVQLKKVDKDTGKALQGVEFVLQKETSKGQYETIDKFTSDENGQIKTSNTLEAGNYQFVETKALDGYKTNGSPVKFTVNVNTTKTQELKMTNEKKKGSIRLIKKDAATNDLLEGAVFKLVDSEGKEIEKDLRTNTDGEIIIDNLLLGRYQLIETKVPESYELDETPIDIEITEDEQVVEKTMKNNQITNILVEKKWNNGNGDTEPVTIKLLPTDNTIELNEGNKWKATFKNLRVYDDSKKEINYKVQEIDVDGYESIVSGDKENGFIITNTELINISGSKTWKDDNDPNRPDSITVQLLENGKKLDGKTADVSQASEWKYSFNNLPKYDSNGEEITYTIEEVEVKGYQTNIENFDITNLRANIISIKGEKTWKDENLTDRPDSIKVNLTRKLKGEIDEDFIQTKTVQANSKGNWIYEFDGLDEFDENGVAYTYIIKEDNIPDNYKSIVDGYNIVNVRIGKTEVSGSKRWKDDSIENRPDSIKVNLLRNNVVIETKEVTSSDNWKYTFSDLDKYDEDGKYYNYLIKEEQVPGYAPKVDGYDITNTRSEKTNFEITKGWLDGNSKERPNSIFVYVYQNEELFETVEVRAEDDWVYELTDLDAYDEDGQPYAYTIKEKDLEGYETTISGFNIVNLRVGKTEIKGTKIWEDGPSEKPTIQLQLYRNGKKLGKEIELKDGETEYKWVDLDRFDENGVEYKYTIDEVKVPSNYKKSISDNGLTITNTYIEAVTPPEEPEDPKDAEESKDPDKIKDSSESVPQTGDETPVIPLMILFIVSLFSLICLSVYRRKSRS